MKFSGIDKLVDLQKNPGNIRNICILAHVDHGKTTLADSFISSNGIISSRLAGQLRYMDSREDEQLRGITMKSSAIALSFTKENEEYLINLIDTPGHVDFSSEVSTAVRLCDGALVVVDVVEGVSPQTHVVLHQAWLEDIRPCLVLNKIDRLITELKYTPTEAYLHLQQVLEQVNAVMGNLFASDILEQASTKEIEESSDQSVKDAHLESQTFDWSSGLEDIDDSSIYFSPEEGNVIFASAIDGWGFGIEQFADHYAKKLGVSRMVLLKTLWGDYYLNSKTMRVMKGAQAKGKKPLFVQFVLENLWAVYDAVVTHRDETKIDKIIKSLNLKLGTREQRLKDPKLQLRALLNKWLPVTSCTLDMVCSKLPSPADISDRRIEKLVCSSGRRFDSLPEDTQSLKNDFRNVQGDSNSPVVAFISKMFAVDRKALPQNKPRPLTADEIAERRQAARRIHRERQERLINPEHPSGEVADTPEIPEEPPPEDPSGPVFIAFARIFSGVIKKGQKLYVMGPKYDPQKALEQVDGSSSDWKQHIHEIVVSDLYLLMGRDLESVGEVPAGNVFGMGGLEEIIFKSGTISSTLACPAFTDMNFAAKPIVRVAVEPKHLRDMSVLIEGMKLLNQADPSVEVFIQETGEHVLVAAGEVHLGKCLKDLRERFAQIELDVSVPIIPFRETIIPPPKVDMVNEVIGDINTVQIPRQFVEDLQSEGIAVSKDGTVEIATPNKQQSFRLKAMPLPATVISLLEDHVELLQILDAQSSAMLSGKLEESKSLRRLNKKTILKLEGLRKLLTESFAEAGKRWKDVCNNIWSFGPRRCGPNILVNRVPGYQRPSIWDCLSETPVDVSSLEDYDSCVVGGFQLVTLNGPMCDEPMTGVCFAVESWEVGGNKQNSETLNSKAHLQGNTADKTNKESEGCVSDKIRSASSDIPSHISANADDNADLVKGIKGNPETKPEGCIFGEITQPEAGQNEEGHVHSNEDKPSVIGSETVGETHGPNSSSGGQKILSENSEFVEGDDESLRTKDGESVKTDNESTLDSSSAEHVAPSKSKNSHTDSIVGGNSQCEGNVMNSINEGTRKEESGRMQQVYGPISGQIISTIKEGCRAAFQTQPQRLMAAMYKCNIQATADVLGPLYSVVSKRCGRVLQEEMREGSAIFDILTTLPVAESFGFPEEIRKKTSGLASPQLIFSHWEVVPGDPYWIPSTEEELLHFGEKADSGSQARRYLDGVRRRKGLHVKEHIVEHAEKQRTLSKNK